ncbi:hypothetical protein BYZ73_11615 [Rhodovulum viride]|uniref:Uncharacterized protein n=1 Tax=Rhodovulum viride TaxID=1231134 RepID=A0ABX9DHA7_9RHOB|nr:hypothetical protein [Rhodovulum viride]RAP41074.1 hypothetical protein BYZ73_11615 [Rhodovulum viride]
MDRSALEALPNFPFSRFRTSEAEFLLLELYWPAVIREAIGPEAGALVVPLAEADQDSQNFGTPVLLSFWIPRIGRGLRVLHNDPPDGESRSESQLFASAAIRQQPPGWELPADGQSAPAVDRMEELVVIADTDPAVADAVAEAARLFLLKDIPLADMQAYCDELEAEWLAK